MKTHYKNIFIRIGTAIIIVALSSAFNVLPLSAQFNPEINYQGKLTNAQNVAVSDGVYHMKFRLYTTASGGTNIWEDDRSFVAGNRITVTSGLFSVLLGSSTPLTSVNFNQTLYLEVLVGGTASTSMETLSPRKKLGAVPAAFEAGKLDGVDSLQFVRSDEADTIAATSASTLLIINQSGAGDILNLLDGGNEVFTVVDGGNVGIGTTTPWAKLSIAGSSAAPTTPLFSVSSSTPTGTTTVFHITSQGNVGIGTTTPQAKLDIVSSNQTEFRIQDTSSTGWAQYFAYNDIGNGVNFGIGGSAAASVPNTAFFYAVNNTDFAIGTDNTTRLTIKDAGNVGIGTTSPYAKLSISSTAGGTTPLFTVASSTNGTGTTTLFHITSQGYVGIGTTSPQSTLNIQATTPSIRLDATANQNAVFQIYEAGVVKSGFIWRNFEGENATEIVSYQENSPIKLFTSSTERMRIDGSGNVGIGTTSPYAKLSISSTAGGTTPLFTVASSTNGTGTTTLFHITSQGNVGIGTSTPLSILNINQSNQSTTSRSGIFITGAEYYQPSVGNDANAGVGLVLGVNRSGNRQLWIGDTTAIGSSTMGVFRYNTGDLLPDIDAVTGDGITRLNVNIGSRTKNVGIGMGDDLEGTFPTSKLSIAGNLSVGDNYLSIAAPSHGAIIQGNTGVGTSSPWAKLSVAGSSTDSTTPLFSVSSSTPTSTTTVFHITSQGNVGIGTATPLYKLDVTGTLRNTSTARLSDGNYSNTAPTLELGDGGYGFSSEGAALRLWAPNPASNGAIQFNVGSSEQARIQYNGNFGIGTTTPGTLLSLGNTGNDTINISGTATSTFGSGINVRTGCFAVNGVCVGGAGGGGSGTVGSGTTGQLPYYAGSGTTLTATSSLFLATSGNIGIGTTTPWAKLSVGTHNLSITTPSFVIASSSTGVATSTQFIVTNGNVGIGTAVPSQLLHVNNSNGNAAIQVQGSNIGFMQIFGSGGAVAHLGTYTDGTVRLGNEQGADTRHIVITSSGNIGIGTTSPYAKLSVVGEAVARNFTATSTTATSTFAGGLNVNSGALLYDYGANKTSIENLDLGPVNFETNAGVVSWTDISVTASSSAGTDISYSAQIDSNKLLTIYGESNGAGGIQNTGVNIGTSTTLYSANIPWNSLIVGDGILCVDNGGDNCDDSARTKGTIYANNATVSGLDLAEEYPTKDSTLGAGDIVMLDVNNPVFVRKYNKVAVTLLSQKKNKKGESVVTTTDVTEQITATSTTTGTAPLAFGVVSTDPGLLLGGFDSEKFKNERRVPLALAGRVPVKMTLEGGTIAIGDRIGPSSIPGAGMKLKKGQAIGIALEPFDVSSPKDENGVGSILVFVDVGASRLGSGIAMGDMALPLGEKGIFDLGGRDIANARSIISESGTWSINTEGILVAKRVETDTLRVGSAALPRGVELYDFQSGALVCMFVQGGEVKSVPGDCTFESGVTGTATTPSMAEEVPLVPEQVIEEPSAPPADEPPAEETVATSATTTSEQL